jgi:BCD family chlorophyll transporter-like MFS transporter
LIAVPLVLVGVKGLERPGRPLARTLPSRRQPPLGFLDLPLVLFLLTGHAALFVTDVLMEPYASQLFGWSLAASTRLAGVWAFGALLSLLLTLRSGLAWARLLGCLLTALVQALMALLALAPGALSLPLPLLIVWLGLAAGLVQAWVAEQVGQRCCGSRLGEQAGGWGAAIVLSRSFGLALAGPLLDGPRWLLRLPQAEAFALALLAAGLLSLAGLVIPVPARPQNGVSAP